MKSKLIWHISLFLIYCILFVQSFIAYADLFQRNIDDTALNAWNIDQSDLKNISKILELMHSGNFFKVPLYQIAIKDKDLLHIARVVRGNRSILDDTKDNIIDITNHNSPNTTITNGLYQNRIDEFSINEIEEKIHEDKFNSYISLMESMNYPFSDIDKIWINGEFDIKSEKKMLREYGNIISRYAHIARISILIEKGRLNDAERIFNLVSFMYRRFFRAKIELRNIIENITSDLEMTEKYRQQLILRIRKIHNDIPGKLKHYLLLEELSILKKINAINEGVELISKYQLLKKKLPEFVNCLILHSQDLRDIESWYIVKAIHHNERGIDHRASSVLYKALINNDQYKNTWRSGWVAFKLLSNPIIAQKHFSKLYRENKDNILDSKYAYWSGRAAEAHNDFSSSLKWYTVGSQKENNFYGQLSIAKLGKSLSKNQFHFSNTNSDHVHLSNKNQHDFSLLYDDKFIKCAYVSLRSGYITLAKYFIDMALVNSDNQKQIITLVGLWNDILKKKYQDIAEDHHLYSTDFIKRSINVKDKVIYALIISTMNNQKSYNDGILSSIVSNYEFTTELMMEFFNFIQGDVLFNEDGKYADIIEAHNRIVTTLESSNSSLLDLIVNNHNEHSELKFLQRFKNNDLKDQYRNNQNNINEYNINKISKFYLYLKSKTFFMKKNIILLKKKIMYKITGINSNLIKENIQYESTTNGSLKRINILNKIWKKFSKNKILHENSIHNTDDQKEISKKVDKNSFLKSRKSQKLFMNHNFKCQKE
jgi:hypothetical protein